MGADGAALAKRYEQRLYVFVLLANYLGVGILITYVSLALKISPGPKSPGRMVLEMLVPGLPILLGASVSGVASSRRRIRPALAWLADDRPSTQRERENLCALPRRLATIGAIHWALGVTALAGYLVFVIGFYPDTDLIIRSLISAIMLGVAPWALSYLFVERSLRPVYAMAVTEEVARLPKTMGLTARFILAWVATTALPIVGIVLILINATPAEHVRAVPLLFAICVIGTLAGLAVAIVAGQTIIGPLHKVRAALRSIEAGDFDVVLPVADTAELGDLEVGINRAALGLRERERMRELFGRHVGDEVARRALEGEPGLGGQRRTATVMFVDIIASTRLAQTRAPEEVVSILNSFFDAVVTSVSAEGGFINKFQGDGALCIFGAPEHMPDHAARALRAARSLRRELLSLPDVDGIEAAIGISSGEVVAGNVGAANRYEYTVIGDPVNEAARLTEQAKLVPARILVSESTIRRASDASGWQPAGTMELRGRAEATLAYEPA